METRKAVDHLGVTPQGGRAGMRPIELSSLSPWWGEAALRLWTRLGDEWLSSKLGRGIRRVPPGEDAFAPSGWAG